MRCHTSLRGTKNRFLCPLCDEAVTRKQQAYHRTKYRTEIESALRRSGVPFEYARDDRHRKTLGTFAIDTQDRKDLVLMARAFMQGDMAGMWVYLWGPSHCGKTHIAASLIAERVEENTTGAYETFQSETNGMHYAKHIGEGAVGGAVFIKSVRLIAELTDAVKSDDKSTIDAIDRYSHVPLLCVDDLGTESVSEYAVRMLYWLFDARNEARRPTIITSNFPLDDLRDRLAERRGDQLEAERIVSRLRQRCVAFEVSERWHIEEESDGE